MVDVHKVTLLIVDHDGVGAKEVSDLIEMQSYSNHCISPSVVDIQTRQIEWSDDHPLNCAGSEIEFKRMFTEPTGKALVDVEELREIEWGGLLSFYIDDVGGQAIFACCPNCLRIKPVHEDEMDREYDSCKDQFGFNEGHDSDCWLAALLKDNP